MTVRTQESLHDFIRRIEKAHFRTDADTGSNECALLVWNCLREYAHMPRLRKADLPSYCPCCKKYHVGSSKLTTLEHVS